MRSVRVLSFLLDLSIAHFCYRFWSYLLMNALFHQGGLPSPSDSSSFFSSPAYETLFFFLYFWLSIGLAKATPAMSLLGIRVLRDDERKLPPGMSWAFSRTLFFFVTMIPFGAGAWFALFSPTGKTLYDCLSQTRVFWDEESQSSVTGTGARGLGTDPTFEK
ncbi:MAG: RDD family protein [Leptospirales bacterium]